MLSGYHLKFLRHLSLWPIRFLIVGAQARRLCVGSSGHDLDLWAEYDPASRADILAAVASWIRTHPLHVRNGTLEALPGELRDRLQLKFPEFEGCGYSDAAGGGLVSLADGIDLMIGGAADPTFAECYGRAVEATLAPDLTVRCLSNEDDARFPRLPVESFAFGS